jgi:hypothetical protein
MVTLREPATGSTWQHWYTMNRDASINTEMTLNPKDRGMIRVAMTLVGSFTSHLSRSNLWFCISPGVSRVYSILSFACDRLPDCPHTSTNLAFDTQHCWTFVARTESYVMSLSWWSEFACALCLSRFSRAERSQVLEELQLKGAPHPARFRYYIEQSWLDMSIATWKLVGDENMVLEPSMFVSSKRMAKLYVVSWVNVAE